MDSRMAKPRAFSRPIPSPCCASNKKETAQAVTPILFLTHDIMPGT
jgi:hypothetical protein